MGPFFQHPALSQDVSLALAQPLLSSLRLKLLFFVLLLFVVWSVEVQLLFFVGRPPVVFAFATFLTAFY